MLVRSSSARIAARLVALSVSLFATTMAVAQVAESQPAWLPAEYEYQRPFFPDATYDGGFPTPEKILGFSLGTRPVTHAQVEKCFQTWAATGRMKLEVHATTHEGRACYHAIISSEKNLARLAEIRESIAKLADPRDLSDADARTLIDKTPAVAWLAYTIHGDEISGTDAAVALTYHLLAAIGPETHMLKDDLIIIIDPIQNPDGRDRFLKELAEQSSRIPNLDPGSLQHAGRWPAGRTNHYYTDMNRDWIIGAQPETRGRQRAITTWNPQLLVDAHEMGPESTYLFNPAREPFNPNVSPLIRKWWGPFSNAQGKAFDDYGWSYYTREWADFWYPGYSDAWGCLNGAIGILYEQAGTGGAPIRLPTGRIMTYGEAVHHQVTSSWSNLNTLRKNRAAILADFVEQKRAALKGFSADWPQTFLIPPTENQTRVRRLLDCLANQGVEIGVAQRGFSVGACRSSLGEKLDKRDFLAGTIVISRRQPHGAIVGAALDFDPHMTDEFLKSERTEIEHHRGSRLYDITGWSLAHCYGLESYWADDVVNTAVKAYAETARSAPTESAPSADSAGVYAYVIDSADDSWIAATAYLLQAGVSIRVGDKPFHAAGRTFAPGSLMIRRHENGADLAQRVREAARASGAQIYTATTARSPDDLPDLGADRYVLLARPRVALVSDAPTDILSVGEVWHLLDQDAGLAVSLIGGFSADLRRYNVLILPEGADVSGHIPDLKTWVQGGGTLIAIGGAADPLFDEKQGMSAVRPRSAVLEKLDEYASAVSLERLAGNAMSQPSSTWDSADESVPPGVDVPEPETKLAPAALDEWRSMFAPTGVVVRGELNTDHWLTFGCPSELPLFVSGTRVLYSKHPVETPVRIAPREKLRLGGLVWPETAARLGDSSWATVERIGNGQLIIFAHSPNFRNAWHGTRRLLLNAIMLGPGCGTSQAER